MRIWRVCGLFLISTCAVGPFCRASTIDQSFTEPDDLDAVFNDCCAFIAQTYTAGLTGTLAGVSVDIVESESGYALGPLDVQIRAVNEQLPASLMFGEATANAFGLRDIISFSQVIPQVAGTQYAIVVHFIDAPPQGIAIASWSGGQGNSYPGGYVSASRDYGLTWPLRAYGGDVHFITYVDTPEPSVGLLQSAGLLVVFLKRIRLRTSLRPQQDCRRSGLVS